MAVNPYRLVRVSTPAGHFNMSAALAAHDQGIRVLKQSAYDNHGRPRPSKLRVESVAATPTTEPEITAVSADTKESE